MADPTMQLRYLPIRSGCDSVGSGDLFGAGYSFGILQGWEPRECTRFAAVFTALSLGKYDTHKILPSFEKVSQILEAEGL